MYRLEAIKLLKYLGKEDVRFQGHDLNLAMIRDIIVRYENHTIFWEPNTPSNLKIRCWDESYHNGDIENEKEFQLEITSEIIQLIYKIVERRALEKIEEDLRNEDRRIFQERKLARLREIVFK